ncbi:response regulator transcription factor [Mucilaginibacter sp. CSA2-8R]|uniref:response regulator transcription factor n=1 Tax=Mucilaginibacter sp. CSA2-8R TaxID=3141542 RepID=UPI00315C92D0
MIKIILADDHNVVRNGIKTLLDQERDMTIIAEATDGQQVLQLLEQCGTNLPDVVITDVNMPVMNGMELIEAINERYPSLRTLVLSMLDHERYITQSFRAGCKAYILKTVSAEELLFAIRHICKYNERYLSAEISLKMLDEMLFAPEAATPNDHKQPIELSKRELEVLTLIADGYTNLEIAEKLFTSKRTVEGHRQNLIDKTGTRNTASLIRFAIQHKYVA